MASGEVRSYRDLDVWKAAIELSVAIYEATRSFPKSETYGLASQMQRAAVSVPSNIAEGQARQHTTEFVQFLSIARGSIAELETQLTIAGRLGYLADGSEGSLTSQLTSVSKMLWGLQNALRK